MTQADNNVVFDERGDVCVNSCRNCPFLSPHLGEHCVLRPEIDMSPLYTVSAYLPDGCPLRPGGLEVHLDFNRDELLEDGKRFPEFPFKGKILPACQHDH